MADLVASRTADLVCLAGYMQLLERPVCRPLSRPHHQRPPRPATRLPGLDAIGQALAAGAQETGVTVHFVDEGVDTGPAILQREVRYRLARARGAGAGDPRG